MAAGKPVVTTSLVNQGIGALPDRDLLIADTREEIASSIQSLLQNKPLRKQLGKSAREFVQQHYRWDLVLDRLQIIQDQRQ